MHSIRRLRLQPNFANQTRHRSQSSQFATSLKLSWDQIERLRTELKHIPQGNLLPHRHETLVDAFDKPIRVYTHPVSGDAIPSVTTVLQATQYNAHLIKWRQRQEDEHGKAGFEANRQAMLDLGSSVHQYIEDYLKQHDELSFDPAIENQITSVSPFLDLIDPRLALLEASVWDTAGTVTGRFDALAWIKDRFYLIDFKTSKEPKTPSKHASSNAQQGAAYRHALLDSVARLGLTQLQSYGVTEEELGILIVTVYGHEEKGKVRRCDVAEIGPKECQLFMKDYERRFNSMQLKFPELITQGSSVGFRTASKWSRHMMQDKIAQSVKYDANKLAALPFKPMRVPPRIQKLLEKESSSD
eukprot:TRINITY_DN9796_c0_g1_i1.p1 TRINITY_DN9796_c0_g1~~TRINITY_DN9796_c0_g1_i1.p1  ORF type:complete len:357 (+),score=79.88 TRINITY_DN9796_c0_g1_i1:480-1550(+)